MASQINRFKGVYASEAWKTRGVLSGDGSRVDHARTLMSWVEMQSEDGLMSLLDLGCGDLTWLSECNSIRSGRISYYGVDVVPELIAHHRRVFPWFSGRAEDLEAFPRISADIVILKDVLPHHCNGTASQILKNVASGRWSRLLVTSHPGINNWRRKGIKGAMWLPFDVEAPKILPGVPAIRIPRATGGEYQIWER